MEPQKRDKIQAIAATVAVHLVVLLVLWFTLLGPEPMGSGSGVLVQVGLVDEASGMFESNATEPQRPQAEEPRTNDDELITQTDEESIQIEKKKEEENKKKAVQENKQDNRIANQVKNAFGKGVSNDGSRGDSDQGSGTQGNPFGNSSTGELTGVGGYGGYNLGGRGLVGSLPYPQYDNSNDAGTIAISITVNPQGQVISAIATVKGSEGTAFSNPKLRASAEAAARRSRFERSNRSSNQTGVIVYIFKQN
ncbi:MAG TPA: energy transducer TonB [Candidatus Barnesiella excrementavium]|nr:energy transducer TonB [Candidatus Barnesiella excrementavium]